MKVQDSQDVDGSMTVVGDAIKAVPSVRFALGLTGIVACVGIATSFVRGLPLVALLPVVVIAIVAMGLLMILSAADAVPQEHKQNVALVFLWSICLLTITSMVIGLTSIAFGWPLDFQLEPWHGATQGSTQLKPQPPPVNMTPPSQVEVAPGKREPMSVSSRPAQPPKTTENEVALPVKNEPSPEVSLPHVRGAAPLPPPLSSSIGQTAKGFVPPPGTPWIVSPNDVALGPKPIRAVRSADEATSEFDSDDLPPRSQRGDWVVEVVSCSASDTLITTVNEFVGKELQFPMWAPGRILGFYKASTILYQSRDMESKADALAEAINKKTGIEIGSWYRPVIHGVRSDIKSKALYIVLVGRSTRCSTAI